MKFCHIFDIFPSIWPAFGLTVHLMPVSDSESVLKIGEVKITIYSLAYMKFCPIFHDYRVIWIKFRTVDLLSGCEFSWRSAQWNHTLHIYHPIWMKFSMKFLHIIRDHICSGFSRDGLVLWVLKSPFPVSRKIRFGTPNITDFSSRKYTTLLTMRTFPQWEKKSTEVGQPSTGHWQEAVREGDYWLYRVCTEMRSVRSEYANGTECLSVTTTTTTTTIPNMQGIHTCIPETNHIPGEQCCSYSVVTVRVAYNAISSSKSFVLLH